MGTTNILDLNNRLTKVEKGNVAQNSYTSLKNKPKINSVTLTGNKSLADIGAAAAADVGVLTDLDTTYKNDLVGAVNEVNENSKTLGKYVISDASDMKDFAKKLIIQIDANMPSTPGDVLWKLFSEYQNVDFFYGFTKRQDLHTYLFSLSSTQGNNIYQGYYNITTDVLNLYLFTGTTVS